MNVQKRVAAIHDISGFGRCSLTVALPIISAAGAETSVIPTAILSTHTGGFTGYTYRDLTEDIAPIAAHWKSLNLEFDAIYTGFLGSFEQIDIVVETIRQLRGENTLVAVDPVMADGGELYSIFPPDFPSGMRKLCAIADLIMPNLTEAALLTGGEYHAAPHSRDEIEDLLKRLSDIGPSKVVLTGVAYDEKTLGAASYDAKSGQIEYASSPLIPQMYHGTGDVFGSALVAALVKGVSLPGACQVAVDFTVAAMARTRAAATDIRFGVNFEEGLSSLKDLIASQA